MDEREEWLTAAECASRTGLTARALRVYEEYRLIAPRRSPAGWRLYGRDELVKLNTIALLKTAGLTLIQIRDVMQSSARPPPLRRILEIQLETWKTRQSEADRGHAIVQTALERLDADRSLSVDELCNLIRSFEMDEPLSDARAGQEADEATLEPAVLDGYTGFYAPHGGEFGLFTVTRSGGKLVMQLTGQPPFDLHPLSETDFAPRVPAFQISFVRDEDGRTTRLVLRQQGIAIDVARVDAAEAERINARLAERIKNQKPKPGSEEALRRLSDGIRAGAPYYEEMSPPFAQLVQRQLPQLQPIAAYLGAITAIEFQGVGSQGWDVYDVRREHGTVRYRIALGADGKILGAAVVVTSPVSLGP